MSEFGGFTVLSFDCYGTLIDWESGILAQLQSWAGRHGLALGHKELLAAFAQVETQVEQETTPAPLYPQVLAECLRRIGEGLGADVSTEEATTFGDSVGEWPAFPDSAKALARLKERFRLVIVSNVDRDSFAASNRRLGVEFDRVITAEDVGAYKPQLLHFQALLAVLREWEVEPSQLLHVAQSLYHDHEPAARLGLASVWIDRRHEQEGFGATPVPRGSVAPWWRFPDLASFADQALAGP